MTIQLHYRLILKVISSKQKISGRYYHFIDLQFGIFVDRNGRWRSKWSITFSTSQGEGELTGDIKSQVGE